MSYTVAFLRTGVRRIILWQTLIVLLITGIIGISQNYYSAISLLYGGGAAIIITFLRGWRMQNLTLGKIAKYQDIFYISLGALERFIAMLISMSIGMGWLRLDPFWIILGFVTAQFGYLGKIPDHLSPQHSIKLIRE